MTDQNNIQTPMTLINRVANSGLENINLEDYFPPEITASFDIKDYLFKELILKEKDFRTALKELDWTQFQDKVLLVFCSTDAIIPVWAYMLITAYAQPVINEIYFGDNQQYLSDRYQKIINEFDGSVYQDKRVVIKGCSKKPVPASAYMHLTKRLRPFAQSIMYGEPCSTVPIFKRPRVVKK